MSVYISISCCYSRYDYDIIFFEVNKSRITSIIWIESLYLVTVKDKTTATHFKNLVKSYIFTVFDMSSLRKSISKAFLMAFVNKNT